MDARRPILISACLLGHHVLFDGTTQPQALLLRLAALPNVHAIPFCPENAVLGTPRPSMAIYGGNGEAVLDGHARVVGVDGRDITAPFLRGAQLTLELCQQHGVQLAIMADISPSCGRNAIYDGDNLTTDRRYQKGPGVTVALLQRHGIRVMAERDFASLHRLLAELDPTFVPDPAAEDFITHPWYRDYFKQT